MSDKEYKVYLRSENRFVDVPKAFYYAYYRPIWNQLYRLKNSGECACPKKEVCYCDGDCLVCKHHISRTYSLDEPFDETGLCLSEVISSSYENIDNNLEKAESINLLKKEILKLSDEEIHVCQLISEGATFNEIAKFLKTGKSGAFRYVDRLKNRLKENLLFAIMSEEGGDLDD